MSGPVALATLGRFHLYDAARALRGRGEAVRLYTAVPGPLVDPDLRRGSRRRPWLLPLLHLRGRLRLPARTTWLEDWVIRDYAGWLARTLGPARVLHALAGVGLEAGRLQHARGRPWVCDRASTHILAQQAVLEEEHRRWGLPPPYFSGEGIERCLREYEEADGILVPSEHVRRSFLAHGVAPARLHTCPFGVDLQAFRPTAPVERRRGFRVGFVGTQSIRKGIGYLLAALEPLARTGAVETWLIGSRTAQGDAIVGRHAGQARVVGPVARGALPAWFSSLDVVVLPSVEDGLATVLAQAMACGVPVIATPSSGAEDLFHDGVEGFVVPARDATAIRERVQWMLDNAQGRQAMAAAALARVRALKGWDAYGARLVQVYAAAGRAAGRGALADRGSAAR